MIAVHEGRLQAAGWKRVFRRIRLNVDANDDGIRWVHPDSGIAYTEATALKKSRNSKA